MSFVLFRVVDALLIDRWRCAARRGSRPEWARALRYLQTGDAQAYAAVMALALLGGVALRNPQGVLNELLRHPPAEPRHLPAARVRGPRAVDAQGRARADARHHPHWHAGGPGARDWALPALRPGGPEFQLDLPRAPGSPSSGISYHVGVDGLVGERCCCSPCSSGPWWCWPPPRTSAARQGVPPGAAGAADHDAGRAGRPWTCCSSTSSSRRCSSPCTCWWACGAPRTARWRR